MYMSKAMKQGSPVRLESMPITHHGLALAGLSKVGHLTADQDGSSSQLLAIPVCVQGGIRLNKLRRCLGILLQ